MQGHLLSCFWYTSARIGVGMQYGSCCVLAGAKKRKIPNSTITPEGLPPNASCLRFTYGWCLENTHVSEMLLLTATASLLCIFYAHFVEFHRGVAIHKGVQLVGRGCLG